MMNIPPIEVLLTKSGVDCDSTPLNNTFKFYEVKANDYPSESHFPDLPGVFPSASSVMACGHLLTGKFMCRFRIYYLLLAKKYTITNTVTAAAFNVLIIYEG
jgi:hypothetical protein